MKSRQMDTSSLGTFVSSNVTEEFRFYETSPHEFKKSHPKVAIKSYRTPQICCVYSTKY